MTIDEIYKNLAEDILANGVDSPDRTGTGTLSVFGRQYRYDLSKGFPLLTTKKVHFKSVKGELLWMLSGSTNNNDLLKLGVTIWNEWANPDGDLPHIYGKQWRRWESPELKKTVEEFPPSASNMTHVEIDQIKRVIESIKNNPSDRGHIVSAWNVADLDKMALRPCHCFFQFYVRNGKLSCQLYQRSADFFLGVPFNIASYALLTHIIAKETDLIPGEFIHTFGDLHIYKNHIDQVKTQIQRNPYPPPKVLIKNSLDKMSMDDIELLEYKSHPKIEGKVSV